MDEALLELVNRGWAHPALDALFVWLSSQAAFALPLALGLLAWLARRWGRDGAALWLALALVVGGADLAGQAIKAWTAQPRPCWAEPQRVRQVGQPAGTPCGPARTGMPSNHAFTFFAAAAFLLATLPGRGPGLLLLAVAALVGLSRIYLGKHYPSQVAAGALLGLAWGAAWGRIALRYAPFAARLHRARPPPPRARARDP